METFHFACVIEKIENNYSASIFDIPGCIATGKTPEEAYFKLRNSLKIHLEILENESMELPKPETYVEYIIVNKASPEDGIQLYFNFSEPTGN